ncbi:hypothetical protein TNCV_3516791 [Trichonephila clavipes]|nr:hypothetical protein TNCV_3516791 [Trichonephila clavipes]
MIRWALKLSEFNIEWEHRPGVQKRGRRPFIKKSSRQCRGIANSCAALRAPCNPREQFIKEQSGKILN